MIAKEKLLREEKLDQRLKDIWEGEGGPIYPQETLHRDEDKLRKLREPSKTHTKLRPPAIPAKI